ncbi:unnamed protein product [Phytomonas sp. EM1]|nr:unnamed protein product [Phytomonas sp. EM1]|eukprot:CCW65864.1 unnamed protein product [Phytomonas sp. isolate EM1]
MTMEVPPFQRPEPVRHRIIPPGFLKSDGQLKCRVFSRAMVFFGRRVSPLHGASRAQGRFASPRPSTFGDGNGVPPPVLKHGPRSQTDAQGRRYGCQYFSRTEREMRMHPWCAHLFIVVPNTDRPFVGCVGVCLFGPERW